VDQIDGKALVRHPSGGEGCKNFERLGPDKIKQKIDGRVARA
jgi:hypothetical protein